MGEGGVGILPILPPLLPSARMQRGGGGGVKVCGPKVAPLSPLPVWEVYQLLLPPGCMPAEVGLGCPPCANFFQGYSRMGDGVRGLWPKSCQGLPPRGGKSCRW